MTSRFDANLISYTAFKNRVFAKFLKNKSGKFNRYFERKLSRFHLRRGRHLCIQAPRGYGKSVDVQAIVTYSAGAGIEPFVIVTADTAPQARDYLRIIKRIIEFDPEFKKIFPQAAGRGAVWNTEEIILNNGCRILAKGTGQRIRGTRKDADRPTLIVVDDPEGIAAKTSEAVRLKAKNWFEGDVIPAGQEDAGGEANFLVVGTAIHPECVVERLAKTPGWITKKFKSIIEWPKNMSLWREWRDMFLDPRHSLKINQQKAKAFLRANWKELHEGGRVLWRDRFPLVKLMKKWAMMGEQAFEAEYQNNPRDPSLCIWGEECFNHEGLWFDEWPKNLLVRGHAIDAALGRHKDKNDYSASVWGGCDEQGVIYVDADLERINPSDLAVLAVDRYVSFQADAFMIEDLVFQELLRPIFNSYAKEKYNIDLRIEPDGDTKQKELRIRRISNYVNQRRFRFFRRSKGAQLLVEQLRQFPAGTYDDGPDALEKLTRLLYKLLPG